MGRWAQRKRTGGQDHYGFLTAPADSDWALDSPASGWIRFRWLVAWPAGAWGWTFRRRNQGTTTWYYYGPTQYTEVHWTGLTPGDTWEGQAALATQTAQASPWSNLKTVVIS